MSAPSFAGFSSLPAELRNDAYKQTLKHREPVALLYDDTIRCFRALSVPSYGRTPLQALKVLSNLNHDIKREARSYFFANNLFEVRTKQTLTTDPDYIQIYNKFLENIGETARRSLRHLRLIVNGDSKQHRSTLQQANQFWNLLADCINLERLELYLDIEYFYIDQREALRSYLSERGVPIGTVWARVLQSLRCLQSLKYLFLHVTYNSRWRYFEVEPKPLRSFTVQVRRPVDEATRLADQIKGSLRQGLRGRGTIQVVPMETWNHSDLELSFRTQPSNDSLHLLTYRRVRPLYRQFNYSNGFKDGY